MSFERLIENKIQAAMHEGKFDNLAGQGQPLDLRDYFNTPADLRLGYAMLKSAQHTPPEVELRHQIESLQQQIDQCDDTHQQAALRREQTHATLKLNLLDDSRQRARRRQ